MQLRTRLLTRLEVLGVEGLLLHEHEPVAGAVAQDRLDAVWTVGRFLDEGQPLALSSS